MTDKDLHEKLDRIIEALPILEALGNILVRRQTAIERSGLHRNTVDGRPTFEAVGKRKTYIEIGELEVVPSRKGTRKRNK